MDPGSLYVLPFDPCYHRMSSIQNVRMKKESAEIEAADKVFFCLNMDLILIKLVRFVGPGNLGCDA